MENSMTDTTRNTNSGEAKKVLTGFKAEFLDEIDFAAKFLHQTRSDFIRQAVREKLEKFRASNNVDA
jgi:metal-responsive CopG/Arc/MetJ family transcriptional regulator